MRYILNLIIKIIWTENYNQSFGSALNNFGVRELLDCFEIPHHRDRKNQETRIVDPKEEKMSGFVLKSMRIWIKTPRQVSIYKIVSGTFERNKPYYHVRLKKNLKFSSPNAFLKKKEILTFLTPVTLWAYNYWKF
jgi:peptide chain release factor 3